MLKSASLSVRVPQYKSSIPNRTLGLYRMQMRDSDIYHLYNLYMLYNHRQLLTKCSI